MHGGYKGRLAADATAYSSASESATAAEDAMKLSFPLSAFPERSVVLADALKVGDQMRISVEQLEQLWEDESLDRMVLVEVREIRQEQDGTKTLWVQRPSYAVKAES